MDGRTWPKVWTLLVLLLLAERTVGQQPPPTWFNADPAAQAQGPSGLPAEGWPQQLPPIVAQRPVMRPPAMGPPALGPLAMGPENVQMAMQAGQPAAPVSLDMEIDQQAPTLEQQLAGLGKRLDVLEKPPVKYPANVQVLGVFQADAVAFSQELANRATPPNGGVGYIENGADFRRARLGAKAMLADNMNAFFQMDFAFPGRPTFTDLWVDWTDLPVLGNVRVGQWKQPFSLEVVSSFRYTTFMERSLVFQAFTPFRHLGVGAYNHSTDLMSTWAASLLRTGQDQFGDSLSTAGGNGFSGRVTRLLWWDEDAGRSYLHVGGDYFLNSPPKHVTSFRSIPEIFVGQNRSDAANTGTAGFASPFLFDGTPFFANTGNLLNVEHVHTFDLEALWVYGPLSVQAEYMPVLVDRPNVRTAFLDGGYVQVGWFLTGEHRPYDRISGAIDRVRPFEDFFLVNTDKGLERGKGAVEVALRLSHLDLNDRDISGGVVNDLTFGVNWYCNPYCKVVFNCVHSWRQSQTSPPRDPGTNPAVAVSSEATGFGLRTQMDF